MSTSEKLINIEDYTAFPLRQWLTIHFTNKLFSDKDVLHP